MNRTSKIVLGLVTGILLLCLCSAAGGFLLLRSAGQVLASGIDTDPARAAEIAASIAEYRVPEGFGAPYAVQMVGFSMVGYTGVDGHSHIYFVRVPDYLPLDQSEIQRQLEQARPGGQQRPAEMRVVEQGTVTIRGQEAPMVVSEGSNRDGQAYRSLNAVFDGKAGKTVVNVSAPVQNWDQATVDEFLASIQ